METSLDDLARESCLNRDYLSSSEGAEVSDIL